MWSLTTGLCLFLILRSVFRSGAQPSPSLLPLCPACLPISHPSRARVCMYIAIIAPSNPHSDVPVVPPHRFPACSQSWRGTISRLPGPRGTGLLSVSLHQSSLQPCIPSVLRCPRCYHMQMCLLLTLFGRAYFITFMGLGVIISHSWLSDLTSPFCWSLVIFHVVLRQLSVNLFGFFIGAVYPHWDI